MFTNWSNTQKLFGALSLAALVLIMLNWGKVWAWIKSLGDEETPLEDRSSEGAPAPAQTIVVVPQPVAPTPPTCTRLKQEIDHFANLFAQYPNSTQIKARLEQLRQQYQAQNCNGGPKPVPNTAA